MEDFIYVVRGETGKYCDRIEWPVVAFLSEEKARSTVRFLEQKLSEQGLSFTYDGWIFHEDRKSPIMKTYDPKFECDHTGVRYYYEQIPVQENEMEVK